MDKSQVQSYWWYHRQTATELSAIFSVSVNLHRKVVIVPYLSTEKNTH